jgi:hypothetical protein
MNRSFAFRRITKSYIAHNDDETILLKNLCSGIIASK